jgi:peptide/nickel transport system substrate-binding protein
MNHSVSPAFRDNRVREAMRLLVDREQIVQNAYVGAATVAYVLYSPHDPCFLKVTRARDVEKGLALLKQAGMADYTFHLQTSPQITGMVEQGLVFAQQLTAAGVKVQFSQLTVSAYYGPQWPNIPFGMAYWSDYPYLIMAAQEEGPGAPYLELGSPDPQFESLFRRAAVEQDEAKRCPIVKQMQQIQFERGGWLIPVFPWTIDAVSKKITGLVPNAVGTSLDGYQRFNYVSFV